MILYLDSSALVKLYVEEPSSDEVLAAVARADVIATSMVAYPEIRSALSRRARGGQITRAAERAATGWLHQDWPHYASLPVDQGLSRHAGELAAGHGLRGFDAVHLAAVFRFAASGDDLVVGCFDQTLVRALRSEGFVTDLGWTSTASSAP